MRKRLLFPSIAFLIILVSGGILYILKPNAKSEITQNPTESMTEKMQQQYETYHAKIDAQLSNYDTKLGDPKLDPLYDKMLEAEDYLEKHAPHLLPPEEPINEGLSDEEFFKILGPEATKELKAERNKIKLERIAADKALEDQLAAWEQEETDLGLEIESDKIKWAAQQEEMQENSRKRKEIIAELDAFLDKLRPMLIFDENGKAIGVKPEYQDTYIQDIGEEFEIPAEGDINSPPASLFSSEIKEFSEPTPPEVVDSQNTRSFDSAKSYMDAREALDSIDIQTKYFDVIVSQYMTPKELDMYFPTVSDREMLKSRKADMEKSIVSEMRKVISKLPDTPPAEKRIFIRKFVMDSFEKSFAKSILKTLEQDEKINLN